MNVSFSLWPDQTPPFQTAEEIFSNCNTSQVCLLHSEVQSDIARFRFIVLGMILGVVEILGIVGNTLSIIVLSRPQMKSSTSYLLLGLAIFDTLVIVNSFYIQTLANIFPYTSYFYWYNLWILPYIIILFQPVWATAYMCSVYLTLAVTIERYIAVCHPLKAKVYCSSETSKRAIYLITVMACVYQLPMYLENKLVTEDHDECGLTIKCMTETEIGSNQMFIIVYWEYMHSLFISFIPLLSLAFFNIGILREIKRANRNRDEMSPMRKNEIDLAKMLLRIVFVFFVCNIIFPILHFTRYIVTEDSIAWPIMKDVGRCLIVVNSCVNFILYIASGTKFRTVFLEIFCKKMATSKDSTSVEICNSKQVSEKV